MDPYPDIGEHGLIGDLQTAALVSTDGTIDWMCCPRFDSPSIFASLLDHDRGGHFRIGPDRDDYVSRQLYFPDTAILITRFMTPDGVGEVVDFMPVLGGEATDHHRLVRLVRVVRGTMRFRMEVKPRFDYGRKPHELQLYDADGARFVSDDLTLTLHRAEMPGRSTHEQGSSLERDGDWLRMTRTFREGEIAGVVMESAGGAPRAVHPQELVELFNDTVRFWRGWLGHSTYKGRWQEQVNRSAIALKLMTYAPSGALVAAPTAALPEQVGGERNWDYRYTWIRDAFVQHYANDVLDASLLLMPLVGFVAPGDPMWLSTLSAMDQELVSDSLVYRYDQSASPDGLRGTEGTFSICTFWYVDALARSGRLEDARLTFEKMSTYANQLGLYSEEIGLTGEQLGNFPQAFSHLALINAALNLNFQLDHGAGWVEPVLSIGLGDH